MSYWQILAAAKDALADGRFQAAEATLDRAAAVRDGDARRVFFQETLPDGLRRLWRRLRRHDRPVDADTDRGRWERATAAFAEEFRARSARLLDRAERQLAASATAAGAVADPVAAANLLADAMYLSVGSRLAVRRLPAAPLLAMLFDLLPASGKLCDPDLVSPDLDLDPALRLRLAGAAVPGLERLPAAEQAAWTGALLALLGDPRVTWLPGTGAQRRWLVARLADLYRDDPTEVLDLLDACDEPEQPEANRRHSRLRRLEILAGRDRRRLAMPGYAEAHRLAALLAPAVEGEDRDRLQEAMAVIRYRRPQLDPPRGWISATVTGDGEVLAVFWWGDEPRDLARWQPAEGGDALREFLEAAGGRVVWAPGELPPAVAEAWPPAASGRALVPYLEAVFEPLLPAAGWNDELGRRLALARSGPWRGGWRSDLAHPLLAPPGQAGTLAPEQDVVEPALLAGLLWLAILHRVNIADPALRAGLGEIARRGDPAAAFLHAHAVLGAADQAAVDATFAPWTLPLLWTRPDPLTAARALTAGEDQWQDLAGQDVAVVTTGSFSRVLVAWGPQERRWRAVLDRPERLAELRQVAREAAGPVTVVPPDGEVHDLRAAFALLDDLISGAPSAPATDQMLPLYHWIRLVETHNGDLLDTRVLRPRQAGACPLHERYAARVAGLPRRSVVLADDDQDNTWITQYIQRVRRSGLVVGLAQDLPDQPEALDAAWGVFDGAEASWVFLDSAAVHWQLQGRPTATPAQLHALLATRGARHLSLLNGRPLFAADLATWLDDVLAAYGRPYHLDLQDARPPRLALAGPGSLPGGVFSPAANRVAALGHLDAADAATLVRATGSGLDAEFWRAAAADAFGSTRWRLATDDCPPQMSRLVLTNWTALFCGQSDPPPVNDSAAAWAAADERRQRRLAQQRQLVALECAALLAEPVDRVEVLDGRWWRMLGPYPGKPAPAAEEETADIELLDLTRPMANARRRETDVTAWLAERGIVGGQLAGWTGPPLLAAAPIQDQGLHLHLAPAATLWRDLAVEVLQAWEEGRAVGRLLLVGTTPPPGAAALAAACAGTGATILGEHPSELAASAYGALVWARPEDLLARLRAGATPPPCDRVLLLDLQEHLPPSRQATGGARLLSWLTGGVAQRVDMIGGPLVPAWAAFFTARRGHVAFALDEPGGWASLRRGDQPRVERRCPQCAALAPGELDGLVCGRCGYHFAGPGPRPEVCERTVRQARWLQQQVDLGRDEPLEIWADREDLQVLATVLGHGDTVPQPDAVSAESAPADGGRIELPDGRRWLLRSLTGPDRNAAGPAVLLQPSPDPSVLVPWAPASGRHELVLLYDRGDIAAPRYDHRASAADRLLRLLADSAWQDRYVPPTATEPPAGLNVTVPLWRLAWLAGVSAPAVRRGLDLLQWAGILTGELPPPERSVADSQPRLWLHLPVRELEEHLADLAGRVAPLLADWLVDGLPGAWRTVWSGTEASDEVLDAVFGVLASGAPADRPRLVYQAPAGAWFSRRRVVGWLGDRDRLAAILARRLTTLGDLLAPYLDGVSRVESDQLLPWPAAADPGTTERLLLGQELGYWTRIGPPGPTTLARSELQRLLASGLVTSGGPAVDLLRDLATAEDRWRRRLDTTPPGGALMSVPGPVVPAGDRDRSSRWWRRGRDHDRQPLRAEVENWLAQPAPLRRILVGPTGSGRLSSLLSALAHHPQGREASFWCPDLPTAVRLHLAARRFDRTWRPRLLLVGDGLDQVRSDPFPASRERTIDVILELQRFDREDAYRLQDRARSGHLLLTVGSAELATDQVWEDLFLTTPRRDEIQRLRVQLLQARQVWRVTRPLLGASAGESRPRRRQRGVVLAQAAGSLDECAAALDAAAGAGRLGSLVRLVAPLPQDVQILQRALNDRGWTAVARHDVDPFLLPGVLESLAGLADMHRQLDGAWPHAAGSSTAPDSGRLFAEFLPPEQAADWRAWLRSLPTAVLADTGACWRHLRRSPWGLLLDDGPAGDRRMAELVAGASTVADLLPTALWRAWRRILADLVERPDPRERPDAHNRSQPRGRLDLASGPPVAVLTTASEPGGEPAESLVYICFGPEPLAVHRRALTQVTDRLLVLYQEHSPLPDQWET